MTRRLFCFGLGYTARVLARRLIAGGWTVAGTCRGAESREDLATLGVDVFTFDGGRAMAGAGPALAGATHLLSSVPPDGQGDPVLRHHGAEIAAAGLVWAGYLSTTGVYGDTGGAVVDELAPLNPTSARNLRRVEAEAAWRALCGVPAHIFRLSGIYGPGRSMLDKARAGEARCIEKPGHRFSRIHVEDIAAVLQASMNRPDPGAVYNLADDGAAEPAEVAAFACELLGIEPPPPVPFAEAAGEMSEMGLTFWRDNRIVANAKIKRELGVELKYPDYQAGLRAILEAERT